MSRSSMAATLANNLDVPISSVLSYFSELEDDAELKKHVAQIIMQSALRFRADSEVRFGRRVAWYAIARILKPKVIVETGIDKGLGAIVLCAALLRNRDEGHPGEYFGTDIDRAAGELFAAPYTQVGSILYGDSISSLRVLDRSIDLFINDSDHSAEYEEREYETIAPKLSARAVLIGDNSHVTDKLLQFSVAHGRAFAFMSEVPLRHWYRGAGIGLSLPPKDKRTISATDVTELDGFRTRTRLG
ncbi:MAG: class I SAM-dependent methyltransferase [Candidatus Acidiferrales bacterium]